MFTRIFCGTQCCQVVQSLFCKHGTQAFEIIEANFRSQCSHILTRFNICYRRRSDEKYDVNILRTFKNIFFICLNRVLMTLLHVEIGCKMDKLFTTTFKYTVILAKACLNNHYDDQLVMDADLCDGEVSC